MNDIIDGAAQLVDARDRTFAAGVLSELIDAVRRSRLGGIVHVVGTAPSLGGDLDLWCRFTRNAMVGMTTTDGATRWTIRCGEVPPDPDSGRHVGSRLWLYSNFDCNLRCDYCCVRSSPRAARQALGLDRVQRIIAELDGLGVSEIFVTGGEPFLLPDIAAIIASCAGACPTTVLTNGMLLAGRRLESLRSVAALDVTLQISLDSPTSERHDAHRGAGAWLRAWAGVQTARAEGFRVRIAATVTSDEEERELQQFFDASHVAARDRVVRRIALRGFADEGVPLARADLVPEVTITSTGVYWHPVGATDADFLVTPDIFPLVDAFAAVRGAFAEERRHATRLATIFNCA